MQSLNAAIQHWANTSAEKAHIEQSVSYTGLCVNSAAVALAGAYAVDVAAIVPAMVERYDDALRRIVCGYEPRVSTGILPPQDLRAQ